MPGTASDNELRPGVPTFSYPGRTTIWVHGDARQLASPAEYVAWLDDHWPDLIQVSYRDRPPLSRRLVGWAFDVTVCSASFWLGYWARR